MINLEAIRTADLIALLALAASLLSVFYAWFGVHNAERHFRTEYRRDRDVLVAANYLALETSSSEIFKYTAENEGRIAPLRGDVPAEVWGAPENAEARGVLINLYYQSLNLFEVCARFRRGRLIEPQVFASWVAWMIELLEDDFFRVQWRATIRSNYTRDVRDIFDAGVEIFSSNLGAAWRDEAFYAAVGDIMGGCVVIKDWLGDTEKELEWKSLASAEIYLSHGTRAQR